MEDQEKFTNVPRREGEEVEESDQEDDISLCDLLTDHYQESEYYSFHRDSDEDNSFEFSFNTDKNDGASNDDNKYTNDAANFCGKIVSYSADKQQDVQDSPVYYMNNKRRSSNSPATGGYRYRYYASNSRSRKHMVLIGLAKIPMEMELSDMKKRQSKRRNPSPMFPVNPGGGNGHLAVAGDNGYGGRRNQRVLARSLSYGAQFARVLARTAFGCFSLVRVSQY